LLGRWLELQSLRAGSFDEFWRQICFAIDNVGLLGIELQVGSGVDRYYSKGLPIGDGLSTRHRISGAGGDSIQVLISGDGAITPPYLFYPIAEIITQALQETLPRISSK
jgi:hypothetical protein